jgi:hypothetical protein
MAVTLYPGGDNPVTVNFGLALWDMSFTMAENFEIIDQFLGGGGGSSSFSSITSGTNTNHTLTVGNLSSLTFTGTGVVNANELNGIGIGGTLTHAGQILISQPGNTTAVWADPLVQGIQAEGTTASTVNPVLIAGKDNLGNLRDLTLDSSGNLLVTGSLTTTPPANASTNVTQFGSNNIVTGTGASGLGIPRFTIANDSSLAANQSVNVNQIGGSAITEGQKTMAASVPVVIASDQTAIPVSLGSISTVDIQKWAGTSLGTPANFGVSPGSVISGSVNASLFAGSTALSATGSNLNVNVSGGSTNPAAGLTGSAPPTSADYSGINVGATLRGRTGVNPTGTVYAAQTDLTSLNGVSLGSPAAYGTSPGAVNALGVNAFITNTPAVTLTSTTITGTVAVTQSTSPWVDNLTQVAGTVLGSTAVVNFGTAPAAAAVPGVNASLFSGTTALTNTGGALNVNVSTAPLTTVNLTQWASTALGTPTNFGTTPGAVVAGSVNSSLFLGTTAAALAGGTAGVQKVGIVGGTAATIDATIAAGTAPTNGLAVLTQYNSATAVPTAAQTVVLQSDSWGNLLTRPYRRAKITGQATTITNSSAATTVFAAQGVGTFGDISNFVLTATPAATTAVAFTATLSDGTVSYIFDMDTGSVAAPSVPTNINFDPPLPGTTANTVWTVALSVNTITVHITVVGVAQKSS